MLDPSKEAETWQDAVRDLWLTGWGNSSDINYTDTLVSLLCGEKYQSCVSHQAERLKVKAKSDQRHCKEQGTTRSIFVYFLCSFSKYSNLVKLFVCIS